MSRKWTVLALLVVMMSGLYFAAAGRAKIPEDKPKDAAKAGAPQKKQPSQLSEFMRKKLESANKILEGLVTEDMDLVKAGARELNEMSSAEKWRVSTDSTYKDFSDEFRRSTRRLIEAAEHHETDEAALKWVNVTMNCLECHRFIRGTLVTDK